MEERKKTISVIIPNFNRERSIVKAINSVLAQSYANFELIIVDDCSTDDSLKKISKLSDRGIKVLQLDKNSGAAAARNHGIKNSTSEFISFLDSDDTLEPDFLKVSHEKLSKTDKQIGFMWTGSNIIRKGKKHEQIWIPERRGTPNNTFLEELKIGIGAGITVKREVFEKCGYFDERLPAAEDTEFFFRITKQYDYVYSTDYLINIFRDSNDRMSKNVKNIARAYNIFMPSYFSIIDRNRNFQLKYYYKMMWLNYHLRAEKEARQFYRKIPNDLYFGKFKALVIGLIYEIFPLNTAYNIHRKLSTL